MDGWSARIYLIRNGRTGACDGRNGTMYSGTQNWHDTAEALMDVCGTPLHVAAPLARFAHGMRVEGPRAVDFLVRWTEATGILGYLADDDETDDAALTAEDVNARWADDDETDDAPPCVCGLPVPCSTLGAW